MKEEYDRCTKQLPGSLATKLLHSPAQPWELSWDADSNEEEGEEEERRKMRSKRKIKKNINQQPELMFFMEKLLTVCCQSSIIGRLLVAIQKGLGRFFLGRETLIGG